MRCMRFTVKMNMDCYHISSLHFSLFTNGFSIFITLIKYALKITFQWNVYEHPLYICWSEVIYWVQYIYLYLHLASTSGFLNKKKMFLQKKSNTYAYQNRCIIRLILYHVCVNLPVIVFSYPAFKFMGLRSSLPLPHW